MAMTYNKIINIIEIIPLITKVRIVIIPVTKVNIKTPVD